MEPVPRGRFEEIYDAHVVPIYRYIYARVGNRPVGEPDRNECRKKPPHGRGAADRQPDLRVLGFRCGRGVTAAAGRHTAEIDLLLAHAPSRSYWSMVTIPRSGARRHPIGASDAIATGG